MTDTKIYTLPRSHKWRREIKTDRRFIVMDNNKIYEDNFFFNETSPVYIQTTKGQLEVCGYNQNDLKDYTCIYAMTLEETLFNADKVRVFKLTD